MMKMPNLGLGTFRLTGQPLRDSLLQGLELATATSIPPRSTPTRPKWAS